MKHLTTKKERAKKLGKQASGILLKVNTLIEEDAYCPDILQQIEATIGLLNSMKRELLTGHLDHCLEHRLKANKEKTIQELLKIYHLSS